MRVTPADAKMILETIDRTLADDFTALETRIALAVSRGLIDVDDLDEFDDLLADARTRAGVAQEAVGKALADLIVRTTPRSER